MANTCNGIEKLPSDCTKPEMDPRVLDITKGPNNQYYMYKTNRMRTDRVAQKQQYIKECMKDRSKCEKSTELRQALVGQKVYDARGLEVAPNLERTDFMRKNDYAAQFEEGRVVEAIMTATEMRNQQHERQCAANGQAAAAKCHRGHRGHHDRRDDR